MPPHLRLIRRWLVAGLALIFCAVYKGPGGYVDQDEYMEMAEQFWLHGSLVAPILPTTSVPPAALPPARYHRYPIGLALVSAPFVWAGALGEAVSGGWLAERTVLCLSIPVFALLACALLFSFATDPRCGVQAPASTGLAASLVFGLGSALLNYQRLYYAETAVVLFLMLALYSTLRSTIAPASHRWPFVTGLALAMALLCHYSDGFLVAGLGLGALLKTMTRSAPARQRLSQTAALLAAPLVGATLLAALNAHRFGGIFSFGYTRFVAPQAVDWAYLSQNVKHVLFVIARVAWLLPALLLMGLAIPTKSPAADGPATPATNALPKIPAALGFCLALGCVAQGLFWLCFQFFGMYPLRYSLPLTAAAAPGLILFVAHLQQRWPQFGWRIITGVLLLWSTVFFLYLDCNFMAPLIQDGDCGLRAFYRDPHDNGLRFYVWYMQAGEATGQRMFIGTAPGVVQWAVLGMLLAAGSAALARAIVLAGKKTA